MSTYITPKPGPRQRGRPKGSGFLRPPERKSTVSTKLSPLLIEIIECERRINETYSDTILRMLKQKTKRIAAAEKKYDALLEEHNKLVFQVNNL